MLRNLTALVKQTRPFHRNRIALESFDTHMIHHKPNPKFLERIAMFVAFPLLVGAAIKIYLMERDHRAHRPEEEIIILRDHMNIMERPFPWRDGEKSLFYNPRYKRVRPE